MYIVLCLFRVFLLYWVFLCSVFPSVLW